MHPGGQPAIAANLVGGYLGSLLDAAWTRTTWAAARYRSMWMGVIVHGVEGWFIVLIVAMLLGWYN